MDAGLFVFFRSILMQCNGTNKVLMAVEGTNDAQSLLALYRTMVHQPACVVLVHVKDSRDDESESALRHCREEIEHLGPVAVKTLIREGVPQQEILNAAREEQADMILLGQRGPTRWRKIFTSRVTKHVEHGAAVPVLVARAA